MKDSTVFDWGQSPTLAPSIKRANPRGWIAASSVVGAAAATLAMALVWRPMLGLSAPPGPLLEHLEYVLKLAFHCVFKSFFAADARLYLAWLSQRNDVERVALIWRAALGAWCFLMPWVLFAKSFLQGRDGLLHLRGSTRKEGAAAVAEINRKLAARVKRRPDHDIAPGVPYPADLWTRHVLVVGGVGSGKSTALRPLIDKVVGAGEQMILFDPKSEFTSGFGGPELIAPWDARSLAWDIAKDMRNLLDMRRFAATMIKESQDPMWSNASRQLLVGLMIYLKGTRGTDWGWSELRDLISIPQSSLLQIMKRWHPEAERAVEKASVTTAGILINLASFCSSIFDLAEAWGMNPPERRVSFVEWIQGRSSFKQIILQGHGAYAELTRSYVEGIVGVASAMVNSVEMADDPKRKIWFIADEFGMMGKIPVRPLFEVGRSRGLRCVVACQDFAQLEELYGAQFVRALIGMCGTLIVGQMMQGDTAEQLCKAFGAREVERANLSSSSGAAGSLNGGSTTLSYNRDEVPLYKPSELSSRLGMVEDGTGVVLLLFTGGNAYELRWPLYDMRAERAPHVPAPWTMGLAGMEAQMQEIPAAQSHMAPNKEADPHETMAAQEVVEAANADELTGIAAAALALPVESSTETLREMAKHAGPGDQGGADMGAGQGAPAGLAPDGRESPARGAKSTMEDFHGRVEEGPKEAIVVQVVSMESQAGAHEHLEEPLFDAAAELAAVSMGHGLMGLAVEAASALDAVAPATKKPEQRVHMGQAQRSPLASELRHGG